MMVILMAFESCETTDQSEWRLIDDVIRSTELNELNWTVKSIVDILVIKSAFSEVDFKEVVEYSLVVRSDYSKWRSGEVSCWTVLEVESPAVRRTFFPSTVKKIALQVSMFVLVKDRLEGGNLWRRWWDLLMTADRQHEVHLREMIIASVLIYPSACMHCLWLEPSLDWTILENI